MHYRGYGERLLREVHCACCGKSFIPAPEHIFKKGKNYYCKWTCFSQATAPKGKAKKD